MRLSTALRISHLEEKKAPCLAFVGAGGKTAALFRLAQELLSRASQSPYFPAVILTTSTHLAVDQALAADRHWIIKEGFQYPVEPPSGVTVVSGPPAPDERLQGLNLQDLSSLYELTKIWNVPLLIEADGARRLPLKAPADYEPVLPPWVDRVVVLAGLSGLDQPLTGEWVHRPERFAALSGLTMGSRITPEAVVRVFTHTQGGLKSTLPGMRRTALLNGAETDSAKAQAQRMAAQLLPAYDSVLIASVMGEDPVVSVFERTAAVILAGGESSRLGRPKGLLTLSGETFVHRIARTALEAGLDPVILVTGSQWEEISGVVADLPIQFVHNSEWFTGQGSSVATGAHSLPDSAGAALFLLVDQPLVDVPLLRSLVSLHHQTLAPIVAPLVDGTRANPVLFDRVTFPDLQALHGEAGGRVLFSRYPVTWLPWHARSPLMDVDTEEDYASLLAYVGEEGAEQ